MGAENLLHFVLNNSALVGRSGNSVRHSPGTYVNVALDPAQFHLFNKNNEETLDRYPKETSPDFDPKKSSRPAKSPTTLRQLRRRASS